MRGSFLLSVAAWAKKSGTQATNDDYNDYNPYKVTSEKSGISCICHDVHLLALHPSAHIDAAVKFIGQNSAELFKVSLIYNILNFFICYSGTQVTCYEFNKKRFGPYSKLW